MAQFPTVETLTSIAGIGGWAGAYHALNVYFEDGPIMADRAIKMAALPVIWSMSGVLGLVLGSSVIKTVGFVYGAMFQPVPFVVNTLIISAIFLVLTTLNHIRVVFKTTVETAAQEMAVDAAEAAAAASSDSDDETEEEEEADEVEAEDEGEEAESETEDEEAETEEDEAVPQTMEAEAEALDSEADDSDAAIEPSTTAPTVVNAVPLSPVLPPSPEQTQEQEQEQDQNAPSQPVEDVGI